MRTWKSFKKELLKDPEFKAEYYKLKPKYDLISAFIGARVKAGLSQKELAEKMGTKQSAIARLEGGTANPTIAFLQRIAKATNSKLNIQFK